MNVHTILRDKGTAVATIDQDASIADAAARMRDERIGALVVSPDGHAIAGILSERDVVRALASHGASALGRSVASAMTRDVATCTDADGVDALMAQMTAGRMRHLPVIDAEGTLAGIISIGDVVKARLASLESERQALVDYLHAGT